MRLVFDGVMTDTAVKVNGRSAGPVHQGGFYRFRYDITEFLKFGADNLLEVEVSKVSADASVEGAERGADYWVFGGNLPASVSRDTAGGVSGSPGHQCPG